jgi:RimJ/RimL family protein N-acetyltransferase
MGSVDGGGVHVEMVAARRGAGGASGAVAGNGASRGVVDVDGDAEVIEAVARLLVATANRGEAVGLAAEVTVEQYRDHLATLLAEIAAGDAGLAVAYGRIGDGGGVLVGSAQWRRSPYATRRVLAELDRVAVHPEARGGGIGAALVEAVAADAAAHGVEVLELEARGNNQGPIALYERHGFRRVGLMRNVVAIGRARYDVVTMCRELVRPEDVDFVGSLPAGAGASIPRGMERGTDWQRTERLLLCRPTVADADAYFAIHADPVTNMYNPAGPLLDRLEGVRLLGLWDQHWREHGVGYWTVRDPGSGAVLGFAGVRPALPGGDGLNLYYRFTPSAWGRGYATEAGWAALDRAALCAPGERVTALIRPDNEASVRVALRLGMVPDGMVERELGVYRKYAVVPSLRGD